MSNTVKTSSESIKNATLARGSNANRLFDLDVTLSDGTTAYLKMDKDTVRATTYKDDTWTELYTLATKSDFNYIDVTILTSENKFTTITEAPKGSEYIPVIVSHKTTNNCIDNVVYDAGLWKIYSTVSQNTTIRFYHMPIS